MPPRRTGFIEYMPQGQRTLTEVDGVVEIGPDTLRPYTAASSRGWPMGRAGAATEVDNLTAGGRSSDVDGARAARGREGERWREHFLLPEQQKALEVRW